MTNQNVSFTEGQTQVNADGSIAINKDSVTPMQDVVAVMKGMGLMSQTKSKTQNKNTKTTTYTYEQMKTMSGAQVKAAYAEMVSKYAETLKKIGFTDEQVKGYVHEALKTKTAENRISSVMRLQEEMGLGTELSVDENVLQSDEPNGTMQEKNVSDIPSASKQSIRRFSEEELEFSHRNIDEFVAENKSFEEVLDDYAAVYSEKVNSNVDWSWNKSIPNGDSLSIKQKKSIKDSAVRNNYIPDVKVQKIDGLRYGFADFKSANVVKEIKNLPEDMWKFSDAKQFDWLDDQLGGHIDGYTWHHTEVPGQMELVPTGLHNIITHNGGRTKGFWAYGQR